MNIGKLTPNGKDVILEQLDNGCIECTSHCKDNCGYTRIQYQGKHQRLFRILYEIEFGKIPNGYVIRHKCDNPSCCNINHLEIGTIKDNVQDMIKRGRSVYGTNKMKNFGIKNGQHKLNEKDVLYIYNCSDKSQKELSKEFNVSRKTIYNIKQGLYWNWLTKNNDMVL